MSITVKKRNDNQNVGCENVIQLKFVFFENNIISNELKT